MELNISILFLIAVLIIVFYQDLKKRTIHVFLPILVFIIGLIINFYSAHLMFDVIIYNSLFIAINIIGLVAYASIKEKKIINPLDSLIGLGDVVFFFAITPLFNLKPFILFFIFGLLFTLLLHFVVLSFKKVKTIPLAGYLSLFLILNLFFKHTTNFSFLN